MGLDDGTVLLCAAVLNSSGMRYLRCGTMRACIGFRIGVLHQRTVFEFIEDVARTREPALQAPEQHAQAPSVTVHDHSHNDRGRAGDGTSCQHSSSICGGLALLCAHALETCYPVVRDPRPCFAVSLRNVQ